MRGVRRAVKPGLMAIAIACGSAMPAPAGQSAAGIDLSGTLPLLPPSAATGKAVVIPRVELAPPAPDGCVSPLPCGTRLLGAIRKDGAVELQVPAWRW
jgi:hypothetical protein